MLTSDVALGVAVKAWWMGALLITAAACGGDASGVSRSCDQAWSDQPPVEGSGEAADYEAVAAACESAADFAAGAEAHPEQVADGVDPLTALNNLCFYTDDPAARDSAACRESLEATP